jgi:hypothetical protein
VPIFNTYHKHIQICSHFKHQVGRLYKCHIRNAQTSYFYLSIMSMGVPYGTLTILCNQVRTKIMYAVLKTFCLFSTFVFYAPIYSFTLLAFILISRLHVAWEFASSEVLICRISNELLNLD